MNLPSINNSNIAIIGIGYVGLPLAIEFEKNSQRKLPTNEKKRKIVGFDISQSRVDELREGKDITLEITKEELIEAKNLYFTTNIDDLTDSDIFIIYLKT